MDSSDEMKDDDVWDFRGSVFFLSFLQYFLGCSPFFFWSIAVVVLVFPHNLFHDKCYQVTVLQYSNVSKVTQTTTIGMDEIKATLYWTHLISRPFFYFFCFSWRYGQSELLYFAGKLLLSSCISWYCSSLVVFPLFN